MDRYIKQQISKYDLINRDNVINFIKDNPENLSVEYLSKIAELVNNQRCETAAYYTDYNTLKIIEDFLPDINKEVIKVLEPSAGVGNFLEIIINKYKHAKKLVIDLNDIDLDSIKLIKALNIHKKIPNNVEINFFNENFLNYNFNDFYDLVIGNPPFLKLSKKTGLSNYSTIFEDEITKNMSGFFLQKSIKIGDNVVLIMPKYFLHNKDFSFTRKVVNNFNIEKIIDFGEKGFKGVLIETIALFINTKTSIENTFSYSVTNNFFNIQKQEKITCDEFPSWVIYRDAFFDEIVSKLEFSIFNVFRDRQITNKKISKNGDIRVLKSRNLSRDGSKIIKIPEYDAYINKDVLHNLSVEKYLDRDDVFLCPNMTYYPRVLRKPKGVVVNGSVAILENISPWTITENDLKFFSSELFEKFYRIARNYSTRSLNIDSNSVKFFGIKKERLED